MNDLYEAISELLCTQTIEQKSARAKEVRAAFDAVQSRLEQAEKEAARLKIILDAQDADDEECQFAVIKNANYDCYQSSSELIDAIDTAMQSAKESQ